MTLCPCLDLGPACCTLHTRCVLWGVLVCVHTVHTCTTLHVHINVCVHTELGRSLCCKSGPCSKCTEYCHLCVCAVCCKDNRVYIVWTTCIIYAPIQVTSNVLLQFVHFQCQRFREEIQKCHMAEWLSCSCSRKRCWAEMLFCLFLPDLYFQIAGHWRRALSSPC